jgi:hypothetical protein
MLIITSQFSNYSTRCIIFLIHLSFLALYALRHFLSNLSEDNPLWLQQLKICLREKFQFYFDEKTAEHQKNTCLVSYYLICNSDFCFRKTIIVQSIILMNLSLCYYTEKDNDFDETVEIFKKYFIIYSSVNMRQVKESL